MRSPLRQRSALRTPAAAQRDPLNWKPLPSLPTESGLLTWPPQLGNATSTASVPDTTAYVGRRLQEISLPPHRPSASHSCRNWSHSPPCNLLPPSWSRSSNRASPPLERALRSGTKQPYSHWGFRKLSAVPPVKRRSFFKKMCQLQRASGEV